MADKISQQALGWVRKVFGRDQAVRRDLSPRRRGADPSGRDFNLLSLYGYDVVGDYLRLDQDLFARFFDYEEMDDYPDLSATLDVYADDATQVDDQRRVTVWVESDDSEVERCGNAMLKRCHAEEETWPKTRSLCKYGNDYEEILLNDDGVQGIGFIPPATMRRIEGPNGDLLGFVQSFSGDFTVDPTSFADLLRDSTIQNGGEAAVAMEGWTVSHTRIRGKYRAAMYGHSILDPGRWIWKRLMLLEDAVLIYKLTRSPSRFAFYVDTGRLQGDEALAYVQKVAQSYKKRRFVNPKTGRLDLQYNPLGMDEDFFLPVGEGGRGTKVDILSGPAFQSMEDVEYFLHKLYAAIKVPRAYLGYDENMPSRATLSQQDVRFARTVLRVQREVRNGWKRICDVDLAVRNIDPQYVDYDVVMPTPSSIFELGQMEIRTARATLADAMGKNVSQYWIMQNVFGMSDDEIRKIMKQRRREQLADAKYEAEVQRAVALGTEGQRVLGRGGDHEPIPDIPLPSATAELAGSEEGGEGLAPEGFSYEWTGHDGRRRARHGKTSVMLPRYAGRAERRAGSRVPGEITEQELLRGRRSDERDARAELERVFSRNPRLLVRIDETRELIREIASG